MKHPRRAPRILVIEDHASLGRFIAATLETEGWEVEGPVADPDAAMTAARSGAFDLVVMDRSLRGEDMLGIAEVTGGRGIPCLLVSGYQRSTLPERFQNHPFLEKPFSMDELIAAVRAILGDG